MLIVIKPQKKFLNWNDFKEIIQHLDLLYFLTWKDFKVRYKQTAIGVLWAILQPFITMVVFTVFFGNFAKMPSDNVPYPIFVYVGLLFWQFFSSAITDASNALIGNQGIVTKVYFPRLILPFSVIITKFVDFFIAAVILIGLMFYYQYTPNLLSVFILPVLLIICFLASAGVGLLLAAINVKYRDVRYALPFFIQLLLFVTPVIYPASLTGKYFWIIALNPMTGVIKGARASVLGNEALDWSSIGLSLLISIIIFLIGVAYFKKTERYFADII